ncbi:MAG: dGTPase [Clostridia bacterium]|jgi:dGTPase|nr:dgt [Clostridiales bacterium]MDK2984964.1 dGTPase [Clostridia bacterium]
MSIRQETEQIEKETLSPYATLSVNTRGRLKPEEPCSIRTEYQRDRDRIIHSKAFRRLKHKTQVFISPEGDHFRTRLTHTLEVSQIARTIARALRLNEDLTEAIALGHDLGHTPFGHAGEEALDSIYSEGFKHNQQSLRVVDELEQGKGLNLTWEVRDGILNHTGDKDPSTLEGCIVKIADRIAYINHDIDDALRAGIIVEEDLSEYIKILGKPHRDRINTMVTDIIENSRGKPYIKMSDKVQKVTDMLRSFLFENVYIGSRAKTEEKKAIRMLQELFLYYTKNPQEIPAMEKKQVGDPERLVIDYIAGMTDRYAIATYQKLFVPSGFALHQNTVD